MVAHQVTAIDRGGGRLIFPLSAEWPSFGLRRRASDRAHSATEKRQSASRNDHARTRMRISATVHPRHEEYLRGQGNYAIVWKAGRPRRGRARAKASDREVRDALESLGAVAGE